MPTLYLIYIIISGVVILSVVLSITDWIYLHSLSSKIATIELEIEKKAKEYDLIKRDRNIYSQNEDTVSSFETPLSEDSSSHEQCFDNQSIEIVRNIRESFEQQNDMNENSREPKTSKHFSPMDNTKTYYDNKNTGTDKSVLLKETENFNNYNIPQQNNSTDTNDNNYKNSCDVMDVVTDPLSNDLSSESLTLPLFSEYTKDADFKRLWSEISDLLQTRKSICINIDFNNINFLYEKELDYLEKICRIIISHGSSSLSFINCDKELANIIKKRPVLLSHLT